MDESAGHTSTAAAAEPAHVAVIIPAYRDTAAVADAVSALRASLAVKLDIVVVNNEPADSLSHLSSPSSNVTVRIIEAGFNSGFTGAVNRGIAATTAPWVFMHNQDMLVSEHHLTELVSFLGVHPEAACASGKILRMNPSTAHARATIDSAGIVGRRSRATFDRGEGEVDRGQYDTVEEVFAASGAGLLVRRVALEDIAQNGEYLDERLFMYKEDSDLGWRLRLRGWRCFYVPGAPAYHVRSSRALAGRSYLKHPRAYLRAAAKRSNVTRQHSMRNQWLIILKNDRWADMARDAPWILGREALVVCATLVTAPRVALGAIGSFVKLIPTLRSRRRQVRGRATMTGQEIRRWFRS